MSRAASQIAETIKEFVGTEGQKIQIENGVAKLSNGTLFSGEIHPNIGDDTITYRFRAGKRVSKILHGCTKLGVVNNGPVA